MQTVVDEIMVSDVITARIYDPWEQICTHMRRRGIHAIPIINDNGIPIGIVSTADLLDDLEPGTPAGQVMTRHVLTIEPEATIADAARIMCANRIHHLVVTQADRIVGILSSFDLLKLLVENTSDG
jgi:CBS domain-containing protein